MVRIWGVGVCIGQGFCASGKTLNVHMILYTMWGINTGVIEQGIRFLGRFSDLRRRYGSKGISKRTSGAEMLPRSVHGEAGALN